MPATQRDNNPNRDLLRYVGLATQLIVALGLALYAGMQLDKHLWTGHWAVWLLPLLVIVALIWKLIRDTSGRKG